MNIYTLLSLSNSCEKIQHLCIMLCELRYQFIDISRNAVYIHYFLSFWLCMIGLTHIYEPRDVTNYSPSCIY